MISNLFAGEVVKVEQVAAITYDAGLPVIAYADPVVVDGVIVSRETTENTDAARPFGVSVSATLTFPRSCKLKLRGARITVGDEVYRVSGAPAHETSPLSRFDLTVTATRTDG